MDLSYDLKKVQWLQLNSFRICGHKINVGWNFPAKVG